MHDLWSIDGAVLDAIVHQLTLEGLDVADTDAAFEKAGVDPDTGMRSVDRLARNALLDGTFNLNDVWKIRCVTERGLIRSGAWPDDDTDRLARRIVAALNEAAENEPEPEKRSKFRKAASSVGEVGPKVLGEMLAAYAARMAGG
jgi:hypothetical protein